jgi:signal transduction histidine kinase
MVHGNAALLDSMLRNLVDNALRHGGESVRVDVALRSVGGHAQLRVEDDGAGVPEGQLVALGDRFQRAAESAAPGSGLGLALARRIAECHGGRLVFGPGAAGRGFRAVVTLPLAGAG